MEGLTESGCLPATSCYANELAASIAVAAACELLVAPLRPDAAPVPAPPCEAIANAASNVDEFSAQTGTSRRYIPFLPTVCHCELGHPN